MKCEGVCTCFLHDTMVKQIDVIRYSKNKWVWSEKHDSILLESLSSNYYNVPKDIISLIKSHSFCAKQNFYIFKPVICNVNYYSTSDQLLTKNLCHQWYLSKCSTFNSFPIALVTELSNGDANGLHILNRFSGRSLPALHSTYSNNNNSLQHIRRTIHMDNCQISINLFQFEWNSKIINMKSAEIYMILLNETNDINYYDKMLEKMINATDYKNKCYILVRITNKYNNINIRTEYEYKQLCCKYNVPLFNLSLNSDNQDLFVFAVKYYWFCNVVE
eukprot:93796_1